VAFPSIATGAFGYPREEAAAVASSAIEGFLDARNRIAAMRLVFFSAEDLDVFPEASEVRTLSMIVEPLPELRQRAPRLEERLQRREHLPASRA